MKSKKYLLPGVLLLLAILLFAIFYVKIPYTVTTNGIILPVTEWRMEKSSDGVIVSILKDNLTNTIPAFSSTEFQRGDNVVFSLSNNLILNQPVRKGDTIGVIHSHLEEYKLVELTGALEEKKRLRDVYLSGDKPELLAATFEQMKLAEAEFRTQERLLARMRTLHQEGVIADQELELAENEHMVKQQQVNISQANYNAQLVGLKKEEVALVDAAIYTLQQQVEYTLQRLEALTIKAPISGTLTIQSPISGSMSAPLSNISNTENLVRIIDNREMALLMAVELSHLPYIEKGMPVTIASGFINDTITGEIKYIDINLEQLNQKQAVLVSGIINTQSLLPNQKVKANIHCGYVTIAEYIVRLSSTIYNN
jgi:multidrug resistance efflux pump